MRRMYSQKQIEALAKQVVETDLADVDLNVASINAKGGAINGPLAVTGNTAIGGDLSVNGDATAKTLSQSEANWSLDLDLQPYDSDKTSLSKAYGKICVVNGVMHIVISCTNTNITESPQNIQSYAIMDITIPESIGSKIFDEEGNDLTTAGTNKIISSAYVRQGTGTSFAWLYHQGANKLRIMNPYNGATLNAGATIQSELRTFLVLF